MNGWNSEMSEAQELISIVAHDLRNPLGCVEGYSEILASRQLSPAEREKILARIRSCCRFMESTIGDILDSTALDREDLPMHAGPIGLFEVLTQVVEAMEHTASSRQIQLILAPFSGKDVVLADAGRIRQAVQNLVSNAIQHVKAGTGRVGIRLHDANPDLIVEVTDNGEGIAPEHQAKIFDKFYRAGPERARGNVGLGLYVAERVVSQHGGKIWVRSDGPGKGASFYFTIAKFDPERAYTDFKTRRGCATPPPRQLEAPLAAIASTKRARGLLFPLALALVAAAALFFHRSSADFNGLMASAGPLRCAVADKK